MHMSQNYWKNNPKRTVWSWGKVCCGLLCLLLLTNSSVYARGSVQAEVNDLNVLERVEKARAKQRQSGPKPQPEYTKPPRKKGWMGIVDDFSDSVESLLIATCFIGGVIILISAIFMYTKHLYNPLQVRLSSVILTTVFGVVLLLVPYVPKPKALSWALNVKHGQSEGAEFIG